MKALFVALCVLAAFIVCSETLECYYCPKQSSIEYCEANFTTRNCTTEQNCVTRYAVLNDTVNNQILKEITKECVEDGLLIQYCSESLVFGSRPSARYEKLNCTKNVCQTNLCNGSPRTTTAMPTTSASTTDGSHTNGSYSNATRAPISTAACPSSSCDKHSFYKNSIVVALLSVISFVRVNSF